MARPKIAITALLAVYSHAEIVARLAAVCATMPHTYDRDCRCVSCKERAYLEKCAIVTEGKEV